MRGICCERMEKAAVRNGKTAARSEKTAVRREKRWREVENGNEKQKNGCAKRKNDSEKRNNDSGEQITGIRKLLPCLRVAKRTYSHTPYVFFAPPFLTSPS